VQKDKISLDSLILLETRAYKTIRIHCKKILKPRGLNLTEWLMLLVIEKKNQEGIKLSEIAETLVIPASQVTLIAKKLESRQLIKAKTLADDNRYKGIHITARGRGLIGEIRSELNLFFQPAKKADINTHVGVINLIIESLAR
jgi:DNA-binding MarR family transcriptional regulator